MYLHLPVGLWMHFKGPDLPHISKNGSVFSLDGIWEEWTDKSTGEIVKIIKKNWWRHCPCGLAVGI